MYNFGQEQAGTLRQKHGFVMVGESPVTLCWVASLFNQATASLVMIITIPTCITTTQHHPHGVMILTNSDSISIVILIVMSSKFPMNHQQHPQASSSRSYSSPPSASSSQPKPNSSSPCTPDGKLGHLFQRETGRVQIVCDMHSSCVACKQSANTDLPT